MDFIIFLTYYFFKYLFLITPNFILKYLIKFIAYFIYIINTKHTKIARINLNLAFKDSKTKEEKEEIIKTSYISLLYNMYSFIENQTASKVDILNKITIKNEEIVLEAIKNERKIIFVTAHYGGWEEAIPFVAVKYGTVAVVGRKMNNKRLNDVYFKARDRNNIIMYEKYEAGKGLMRSLKQGHNLAVAIDQNTPSGIEIDFFATKCSATDVTSRLACKYDALIIPIFATMNDFRKYTIEFKKAIDPRDFSEDNKILDITQKQADIIESVISKEPKQWFWQHKRWKSHNKDLYKGL